MKFKNYLEEQNIFETTDITDEMLGLKTIIHELSARADVFPQIWGNITADNEEEKVSQAKQIYNKAKEFAMNVKKKFLSLLKRSSQFPHSKVLVDIKGIGAFIDKAINRYPKQGKGAADITDVLRSAVLVNTQDEVDSAVKNIKKLFTIAKHKEKKVEGDPKYGYFGSHHFYVKIENILAEIQVMTKKLWTYKEEAHKIYNKYRSIKDADKRIETMDTKLSKRLFQIANTKKKKRRKGKPELKKHKRWVQAKIEYN